ncbi:hypothetical protein SUDANB121_01185 [Nocardiopsis dassonvillei]|uniref:hypothetical protein n=1 Tax=Nocardiopsis dassonvillei TaxID=2014 RepID=UPI003F54E778
MPDRTKVRWDADLQRWAAPPRPGPPPEGPGRAVLPTVVLTVLAVLLLAAAIGVHTDASGTDAADSTDTHEGGDAEYDDGEPYEEDPIDDEEDRGLFPGEPDEETPEEVTAPAGYELSEDPAGFSLYVPEDWGRQDDGPPQGVFYTGDGRRNLLQIMDFAGDHDSPQEAMDALVAGVSGNAGYSDHGRWELDGGAVELNYVYDHAGFGPRDVYVRAFLGQDGEVYAVLAAAGGRLGAHRGTVRDRGRLLLPDRPPLPPLTRPGSGPAVPGHRPHREAAARTLSTYSGTTRAGSPATASGSVSSSRASCAPTSGSGRRSRTAHAPGRPSGRPSARSPAGPAPPPSGRARPSPGADRSPG